MEGPETLHHPREDFHQLPKEEKFERYYYRMKTNKEWLKDVRNHSSYSAIRAHLKYCREDFQAMIDLRGMTTTLKRTKGWNPLHVTAESLLQPREAPDLQEGSMRPLSRRGRNTHSRHPRNTGRNTQWRSQIYEEMVRLGRSLQGTYQHLEKGKINRQHRFMEEEP
ncbi:hypothetical protein PGTUg99_017452 [Puccinia graminis f. sp. tritici]|uniref:Uncharacterized protein n=1 Tax=Puccinia graminis f. sp. tritici TaxID=56615 RepID=A0A5B0SIG6_PUCGR|nr:hypothetical protein PGTUg99_017452 [Puccinia graminis f. sp. tritici]